MYELGVTLFRDVVAFCPVVFPCLSRALLSAIDLHCNGEVGYTTVMSGVTRMLFQLREMDNG